MHFIGVFYSGNVLYTFRTDKLFILRRHWVTVRRATYRNPVPPEDEQLVCSKHVEDIFRVQYMKKVRLVCPVT